MKNFASIYTLLSIRGVGLALVNEAIQAFPEGLPDDLPGLHELSKMMASRSKRVQRVDRPWIDRQLEIAKQELCLNESTGTRVLTAYDPEFPQLALGYADSPAVLYCRGNTRTLTTGNRVAIIGTRKPTGVVTSELRRLSAGLAETGDCIVSGMAKGCDEAAHLGCLDAGGRTIAVLPCGLDQLPSWQARLADRILQCGGLLLSEYPTGTGVADFRLVQRDRIQALVAHSLIVGQSSEDGGAMHAARRMISLGRPMLALNPQDDGDFSGNRELLKTPAVAPYEVHAPIEKLKQALWIDLP
jgi:DNA processing protein